jgi:hypothetical protein
MNKRYIAESEAISCEKWWINHSSELSVKLEACSDHPQPSGGMPRGLQ